MRCWKAASRAARSCWRGGSGPTRARSAAISSATARPAASPDDRDDRRLDIRDGLGGLRWDVPGADLQRDPRFNCRPYPARDATGHYKANDLRDETIAAPLCRIPSVMMPLRSATPISKPTPFERPSNSATSTIFQIRESPERMAAAI